jgi:hypothetical protein
VNKFSAQLDGDRRLRLVERNGLGPNAAADPIARLQDGDALAGFGKQASSIESGNTGADDQHIVIIGCHAIDDPSIRGRITRFSRRCWNAAEG